MQNFVAVVAGAVRYVQPPIVALVDELVELDVTCDDHLEQLAIVRSCAGGEVARLASQVLAVLRASDCSVQLRRTVATIDTDRLTPQLAHLVEALIHQRVESADSRLISRRVADAELESLIAFA